MPAFVEAVPHEDGTAYQIVAIQIGDIQVAIDEIIDRIDRFGGYATFERPHRCYSMQDGLKAWRTRGFARPLNPTSDACADVRAWQRQRAAR